ncbi:MAG TPA: NAD(P)-dependent oxidoreductase [Urbifossiella sp.]|nr:NAD(P)-dependent oxidoreductase [Urbifossiella sp.]
MFPVTLDLTGRTVVVVGGGAVGRRKATAVAAAGAHVLLVDPTGCPGTAVPGLSVRTEDYSPAHLTGAALVFACATPEVNARVVADGRALGVWVNSATDPAGGDFTLPAVHAVGRLTLAVATGGASPALARRVRDRLAGQFDAAFAAWVELLNEVRGQVLVTVADPARRRQLLDDFADWPWLDRVRAEGVAAVRAAMLAAVGSG